VDIVGFTMVRNAQLLDYPLTESICSMLPICQKVIVNVCSSDDHTLQLVQEINSPKIEIMHSPWNADSRQGGALLAQATNRALAKCRGDWGLYLQADEVIHEDDVDKIIDCAKKHLHNPGVEGLLFDYLHFYGGYNYYQKSRNWYRREVRMVRLGIGVHSYADAQGFRIQGRKLRVVLSGARIFHYGWVRHPKVMSSKYKELDRLYHDDEWMMKTHPEYYRYFDYGSPDNLELYQGTHPQVMQERIASAPEWLGQYQARHEHDRLWVRILSWLERKVLHFRIGEYRNYILLKGE
jgi:glycosyltransferase involved in cell wall biosynthesis